MKKFRFTLQTVHDLREARRDEAERALATASRAVDEAEEQLAETSSAHERAMEEFAARLESGELDPFEAELSVNYLASLVERKLEAHARLKELEERRERQREETIEAARSAETTARLRDRQREKHQLQMMRAEQQILDEMAMLTQARLLIRK